MTPRRDPGLGGNPLPVAPDEPPLLAFRYYRRRPRHVTVYCGVCGVRLTDGTTLEGATDLAYRNGSARPCCDNFGRRPQTVD